MITILNTKIKKFDWIVQFADCHIRLTKRHDEFREVFDNFYKEIKNTPPATVVVCCGDVLHNKNDLNPECVQMAADLFTNISAIRPLVIIAGNHDGLVQNKSRLDSISPIVDALNNPNIFYLKNTGLYGFGNILFNNMGVFDSPEKYIRGQDIPAIYRNQYKHIIALFHGAVDKAALYNGYSISNPTIPSSMFDDHHLALLGDIHACQNMDIDNSKLYIRYVGSLIQQDHGESLKGHGYSLWDLSDYSYIHHELKNDYGYFTIDVVKGKLTTDLKDIPKNVRLRVKCYESIVSEVKQVVADIKMKTNVVEIAYVRMDKEQDKKDIVSLCTNIVLSDLTNVDYQNKLITEFAAKKLNITNPKKLEDILAINKNTNTLIKKDDFSRNLKWSPIRMEWSNTFAYGEDNVINFESMNGIYGIFGKNKSGKSSILDTLLFILFDKTSRSYKGSHVLNVKKTSFKCKLEFEISGIRYFIERRGNITSSGNVKVDVKFWRVVNGVEEELQGTMRHDTNEVIRDYIGTYDDFVLTAASFQHGKNLSSFIDMGNSERKDLLVQFIGLNIFDRLHESAGERSKELLTILKTHKDKNYQLEIQQNQNALTHSNTSFADANAKVEGLKKQIVDINEQIIVETTNLIKLDANVPIDIELLKTNKNNAESALNSKQKYILHTNESLINIEKQLYNTNLELDKIEKSDFAESHKIHKELSDKISNLKQKIDLKKVSVKGKLDKVARLKNHKYDPKCKFCIDNDFVRDANKAKKELIGDKKDADKMSNDLDTFREELAKVRWVEVTYETYTKLLTDRGTIKDKYAIASKSIITSTNELERLDAAFKSAVQQIEVYYRNEASVKANNKFQSKILSCRNALAKLDLDFHKQHHSLVDIGGKRELFISEIKRLTKTIEEVTAMESEAESYHNYLDAVGRDGISYQVICEAIIEIEKEVNSILSQVVDFTIQFETDGKNVVPYIVYSDVGRVPIELASGYERFVSSIVMRVALFEKSVLPRFSCFLCDEGFSTLDAENLLMMPTLFTLLKNSYDIIIIISHNEALRDSVDKQIEITHENGFAKVAYD